uniref:Uncharacterized protein n=1 Tax=Arundo donax TaxID=35708 RepID=A0A0A9GF28_ARUDO
MEEVVSDGEVREVDDGPCSPGGAAGDGEDEEPGEEEKEDVGGPDARVHEPLGVLVQVHRRRRLHVVRRPPPPHLFPPGHWSTDAGSSDLGVPRRRSARRRGSGGWRGVRVSDDGVR